MLVVVVACSGPGAAPDAACVPSTAFLNRAGGLFDHSSADDSSTNHSVVVDMPRMLPAWPRSDAEWTQLVSCVREGLAQLAIVVTEQDPGAAPHVEIVFTTSYWAQPAATTMLVPASCRPGHEIEFVFGDALPPTYSEPCREALIGFAEMTALLSPVDDCRDIVNRASDCAPTRSFLDQTANCVDDANQPAPCRCGGTTENTYRAMASAHPACP
jgi:hypothetical protein